jgi:hypothetical protein
MRGAREIDERRRTYAVRWSEAIECNEAGGPFSSACKNLTLDFLESDIRQVLRIKHTDQITKAWHFLSPNAV